MQLRHAALALYAVVGRECHKFFRQPGRLFSALVRPLLWLVVFAAGFQNVFGISIVAPYQTYIEYRVYILPGLLGMIALFNGMQGSLAMVYEREMGVMRLLLTAPLPRAFILLCKLLATSILSVVQMLFFLAVAALFGVQVEWWALLQTLPLMLLVAVMLAALGLLLSVYVKQLENFAGTMNFVIFPMFFISSALYPLWKFQEAGANWLYQLASYNPLTQAIEMLRYTLYAQWVWRYFLWVLGFSLLFFLVALWGYDPQRGWMKR